MLSNMPDSGEGSILPQSLADQMAKYIGATVTIYTAGGGESGRGFTGILSMITPCFVRLLTCVGSAPCCPLGGSYPFNSERRNTGGHYMASLNNVGSAADIPLDKVVAFVHKM